MSLFPQAPKKIQARIRSYERKLKKEKEQYGMISDGYGKRYLLGPLYLLMDDLEGAVKHYRWFEHMFPDDSGDPMHLLRWVLALYRANDQEAATRKLRHTMLSNLYLIPHVLGKEQAGLDIWHGSNLADNHTSWKSQRKSLLCGMMKHVSGLTRPTTRKSSNRSESAISRFITS